MPGWLKEYLHLGIVLHVPQNGVLNKRDKLAKCIGNGHLQDMIEDAIAKGHLKKVKVVRPSKVDMAHMARTAKEQAKMTDMAHRPKDPGDTNWKRRYSAWCEIEYEPNGSLAYLIQQQSNPENEHKYSPEDLTELIMRLACCVYALQVCKIYHCDLKPANIVIGGDDGNQPRIIDFGNAYLDENETIRRDMSANLKASVIYSAPEVMVAVSNDELEKMEGQKVKELVHAADIWALGVIILEMNGLRCETVDWGRPDDSQGQMAYRYRRAWRQFKKDLANGHADIVKGLRDATILKTDATVINGSYSAHVNEHVDQLLQACLTFDPVERARAFEDYIEKQNFSVKQ